MQELTTTSEIIDALGGTKSVARLTGSKYNAVANWRGFGAFPARTYVAISSALAAREMTAPAHLWKMVEPAQ